MYWSAIHPQEGKNVKFYGTKFEKSLQCTIFFDFSSNVCNFRSTWQNFFFIFLVPLIIWTIIRFWPDVEFWETLYVAPCYQGSFDKYQYSLRKICIFVINIQHQHFPLSVFFLIECSTLNSFLLNLATHTLSTSLWVCVSSVVRIDGKEKKSRIEAGNL